MIFYVAQKLVYDPDFSEVIGVFTTPELAISAAHTALENVGKYAFESDTDAGTKIFTCMQSCCDKFMVFPIEINKSQTIT